MKCYECGKKAEEKHHIVPKTLGGTKTIPLCSKCHCKIHGLKGNRLQATSLIKYGMYKKHGNCDLIRVFAFCSCDQFDYTHYNAHSYYKRFSGDENIERAKFNRLLSTVAEWIKDKRWEWFLEIASRSKWSHLLVSEILNDYYNVKNEINDIQHVYTVSDPSEKSYSAWINHNVIRYWKEKSARFRAMPNMYKSGWLKLSPNPVSWDIMSNMSTEQILKWCNDFALIAQSIDAEAMQNFLLANPAVTTPHSSPTSHTHKE